MSYRRFSVIILAILLVGLWADASGAPAGRIDPADLKNIMLVKDVKPGMRGYGRTVFRGVDPETFQVEVLGVLPKFNLGTELVLVRVAGGPITKRGANLIEGMSGSPIYVSGKLLGAFAYGWAFGKEPLGLVTPIQYMLEAWDPALPSQPSSFYPFNAANLDEPIALGGQYFGKVAIDCGASGEELRDSGTLVFRPLATPVMVSGMSPRIMARLQDTLRSSNVNLVAGPGLAADKAGLNVDLRPGSAVGVSLVTGDVDITGIGTLTYRRGNKIAAFGHPMLMGGVGALDAPLTTAYVYDVFPGLEVSMKIAAPMKTVGRISQDRPWSIAGEIGELPKMIPVTVNVNHQSLGRKRVFRASVINHPLLSGMFIGGVAAEGIYEVTGAPSDATAKVKLEVVADEVGTITRENTYFDAMWIDEAAVSELEEILMLLQFNPFHPVDVKSVNLSVDLVSKHQTAKLERIFLKESKFEPGDTIEVGAVLRPFKGEKVTKTIKLELPRNIPSGRMSVMVYGGGMLPRGDEGLGPEMGGAPGSGGGPPVMPGVENLQQLIKKYLERERGDELVAKIVLPKPVPSIAGEKLSGLPPSIAEGMRSSKTTMFGMERDDIKVVVPTDWVILGMQKLTINVQEKDKSEKKAPGRKAPEESAEEEPDGAADAEDEEGVEDLSSDAFPFALQPVKLAAGAADGIKAEPAEESETGKAEGESNGEPEAKKEPTSAAEEKPVGRGPGTWKQTARAEFLAGTLTGTAATTDDLLTLAGSLEPLCESGDTYVWCILPDGEDVCIGTGNNGVIYKIAADGTASVLYDSPELEIHSLAKDSAGSIYAGTSPNGMVYRIDASGKASTLFDADEKYIIALAVDSKGSVYAAAGDKCRVYKIAPDGKAEVVLDSSESHALSLVVDGEDNLHVGTGLDGIIYKVSAAGDVSILYDAAEDSVTALAVDPDGVLYAGTSPKGAIYKLAPDATPKAVYEKAGKGILGISADAAGNIYAVNSTNVFKLMPDESVCTLDNKRDLQFLSLAVGGGRLYAGTGNIGSVYCAEIGSITEGTYESPVHDCGLPSKWGIIEWTADLPKGTSVTLQTRTGCVAQPDSTWSDWSAPYSTPGTKISSPPGRYVQYMATLRAEDASVSPALKDVSIVYLAENQAPKVTLSSPSGGEKWAGKKTIKWKGSDPDKDTLTYEVFYSADDGATWQQLGDKIKPAAPEEKEEPQQEPEEEELGEDEAADLDSYDPEQILAEMAAELDKHSEIPQEVKDRILSEAPAAIQEELDRRAPDEDGSASEPEKPSADATKQTSFPWDTAKLKDGTYLIKVVASDRLSNATGALTAEAVSEPLIVSNKAPRIVAFKKTLTVQSDRSVRVEGAAYQDLVGIAGVQYRIGSGDWAAAAASDGIFDSKLEAFTVTTQPLEKGEQTIELKAIDQAGNSATTEVTAKVE